VHVNALTVDILPLGGVGGRSLGERKWRKSWGNAVTHLAHSVHPLKLFVVPDIEGPKVLRLVPWVPP